MDFKMLKIMAKSIPRAMTRVNRSPGTRLLRIQTAAPDVRSELVFEQACKMGLKGIVSKRLSKPYQSGRSGHWLKIKNPGSPAMVRARDHFAQLGP
jgi:hypothetical protein